MKKKPGPGRKPLPEGEGKTVQVAVRLTTKERKLIEEAASKDGRTISSFMRWCTLAIVRGEL